MRASEVIRILSKELVDGEDPYVFFLPTKASDGFKRVTKITKVKPRSGGDSELVMSHNYQEKSKG